MTISKKLVGVVLVVSVALVIGVVVLTVLLVSGRDTAASGGQGSKAGLSGLSSTTTKSSTSRPTTTTTTTAPKPGTGDFTVELKVSDKQCFGSAGCSVTVEPSFTFSGSQAALDTWACDLTYDITGSSDGVVTKTAPGASGGRSTVYPTSVQTKSSSAELKAKVTSVDCR